MGDLSFWLSFLKSVEKGISINRVVFCKPTIISLSDASKADMDGFYHNTGVMRRHCFMDEE